MTEHAPHGGRTTAPRTPECANGHKLAGFEPCPFCILEARDALRDERDRLRAAIEDYLLWEPGRAGHAAAARKLKEALDA